MSSKTCPGKRKAYLFSQTFGALYDGSSLPSRAAQIKVPKPYLLQGEASTAQHIPPTSSFLLPGMLPTTLTCSSSLSFLGWAF